MWVLTLYPPLVGLDGSKAVFLIRQTLTLEGRDSGSAGVLKALHPATKLTSKNEELLSFQILPDLSLSYQCNLN